jgi:hypothetical protein
MAPKNEEGRSEHFLKDALFFPVEFYPRKLVFARGVTSRKMHGLSRFHYLSSPHGCVLCRYTISSLRI